MLANLIRNHRNQKEDMHFSNAEGKEPVPLASRCSVAQLCLTLDDAMDCSTLGFVFSWSLLKLLSIELMMPSNHLILVHPLLLLPSILPSIRVFFSELALYIR